MKAMILAAGFGTRFLPLTEELPKPLLPLFNTPMIFHTLDWLKANGVKQVIINLHHLGELIYQVVGDGKRWNMEIAYSWEKKILGTGGGVKKAAQFFGDERFLLVNSDVFLNIDLKAILDFHENKGSLATMLLLADNTQRYGAIGINREGLITQAPWQKNKSIQADKCGMFSGVHILEPEILSYLPESFSCINKNGYQALMDKNLPVYGYLIAQQTNQINPDFPTWCDLGEPDTYLASHWQLLELGFPNQLGYSQIQPGIWCAPQASLYLCNQIIPPVVIGQNCRLSPQCQIGPNVILGNDTQVQGTARIESSIALAGSRIPPGSVLNNQILGKNTITLAE